MTETTNVEPAEPAAMAGGVDEDTRRTPDDIWADIKAHRDIGHGRLRDRDAGWMERELAFRCRRAELWRELADSMYRGAYPDWAAGAVFVAAGDARGSHEEWGHELVVHERRREERARLAEVTAERFDPATVGEAVR
jgi:hypothetical protein